MKLPRQILAISVTGLLILTSLQAGCATQQSALQTMQGDEPFAPAAPDVAQSAVQSPGELDQLVAPIALYPDALVAQVLAAATYPAEVVEADRWLQQNANLKGQALAQAVNSQSWDPSVKALTQFPSVLAMMDRNLAWTSALGEAYASQPESVLAATQAMRGRAQQAGNLQSTSQESVTKEGQTIVIEPAIPDVVYVPEYDPWVVYGAPVELYPGWTGIVDVYPGVYFGAGIDIGFLAGFGWGWHHWDADWHRHSVWYDHHPYHSHSPTFQHFGPGHGEFGHPEHGTVGIHTGAFGGFNHGGVVGAYSARGHASLGGGVHTGGLHAGGFGGGGFHGGGGHR
jgi:uncharacterized membrane protein YgcG